MSFTSKNGQVFESQDAYIKWLEDSKAALEAKNNGQVFFRVTEEMGTVGIYGFNAKGLPIATVYAEQMPRLVEALTGQPLTDTMPVAQFITKAAKYLSLKGDTEEQKKARKIARLAELNGIVSHPKNSKNSTATK